MNLDAIKIDKTSKIPLYIQISDQIKSLLNEGIIEVEDKLPPIRLLSQHLNVNNVTIVNAYQLLSDEKVTYKVRGSGSYIAPKSEELMAQISEFDNAENQVYQMKEAQMVVHDCNTKSKFISCN